MEKINIKIEVENIGEIDTSHYKSELSISLIGIEQDSLIREVLANVDLDVLLMQIETEKLQEEIIRRMEENDDN